LFTRLKAEEIIVRFKADEPKRSEEAKEHLVERDRNSMSSMRKLQQSKLL
jgi:hypothetical protein